MVGMPYYFEKGAYFSYLEDYVNQDVGNAGLLLGQLRDDRLPLDATDFFNSAVLDPVLGDRGSRRTHLAEHWFGRPPTVDGATATQIDFIDATLNLANGSSVVGGPFDRDWFGLNDDATTVNTARGEIENRFARNMALAVAASGGSWPTTGHWVGFYGDVEEIFRQALVRSLEVSLGIDHGAAVSPTRHLPVSMFWKCPQSWVEGWVSWRYSAGTQTGHVSMTLATPGNGHAIYTELSAGSGYSALSSKAAPVDLERSDPAVPKTVPDAVSDPPPPSPPYSPDTREAPHGLWVIGHEDHLLLPDLPLIPARQGDPAPTSLGPYHIGLGPVGVVAPREADGGVHPEGRKF